MSVCSSSSGFGTRTQKRKCVSAVNGAEVSGCQGETCQTIPCSGNSRDIPGHCYDVKGGLVPGQKSCVAYEGRQYDVREDFEGEYRGEAPSSFSVAGALDPRQAKKIINCEVFSYNYLIITCQECLDACLQDEQCQFASLDSPSDLCWKFSSPPGWASGQEGHVAFQCGYGPTEW